MPVTAKRPGGPSRQHRTRQQGKARRRSRARPATAAVVPLEPRLLLCVAHADGLAGPLPEGIGFFPPVHMDREHAGAGDSGSAQSGEASGAGTAPPGAASLAGVPQLSSNPAARAKLYLDFDGDGATNWG